MEDRGCRLVGFPHFSFIIHLSCRIFDTTPANSVMADASTLQADLKDGMALCEFRECVFDLAVKFQISVVTFLWKTHHLYLLLREDGKEEVSSRRLRTRRKKRGKRQKWGKGCFKSTKWRISGKCKGSHLALDEPSMMWDLTLRWMNQA